MDYIKKPSELISRSLKLEQPVSELLDDYSNFIECTPDHVTNYVLKKPLCLANCYFAHNSLRIPALLPFFNASSLRPFSST
jgi:hypothetical protein